MSDVAVEAFCAQKRAGRDLESQAVSECLTVIPVLERETVEERAAILEFEGGLKTSEAERQAFGEWSQAQKATKNQPRGSRGNKKPRKKMPKKPLPS